MRKKLIELESRLKRSIKLRPDEIAEMNRETRRNNTIALILSGTSLGFALSRLVYVIVKIIVSK